MKKITYLMIAQLIALRIISQTLPTPNHVIVLMLENKGYNNIIGNSNAPFINSLLTNSNCAIFSESYGVTHPSQPNYISLYSGNNQGVVDDNPPIGTPFNTCNLGSSLLTHGHTFKGYSEDLPAVGSLTNTSGNYVQRHCPWSFWQGSASNQVPDSVHQPYSNFPDSNHYQLLPTVSFIIPNLAHDMHDPYLFPSVAIANGDFWLNNHIQPLIRWLNTHNSLLIIQYDEDETILFGGIEIGGSGNQIPTMFIGPMVHGGVYTNHINHFNVLRTIEDMYALPQCDSSALYAPISNCWNSTTTVGFNNKSNSQAIIYPIPASNNVIIKFPENLSEKTNVTLTDMFGKTLIDSTLPLNSTILEINTSGFVNGTYILTIKGNSFYSKQKIIIFNT